MKEIEKQKEEVKGKHDRNILLFKNKVISVFIAHLKYIIGWCQAFRL